LSSAPGGDPFRDGVALIHKQLFEALERAGLEVLPAQGEPFDPLYHEAVAAEPTDQCTPNMVLEEIQKGYRVSGRVLRPAIVKVSAPARETEVRGEGGAGSAQE
jgi:molecular chaperone GrpE